jgi:cyclophilin family peptidyl-prolyl cis-trans isomerase
MPSEKRQRQDEGRLNRRIAEQAAAKRQTRNRNAIRLGIAAVVVLGGVFLYSVLSGDDGDKVDTATSSTTAADTAGTDDGTRASTIAVTYPGPGASVTGDTPCPKADGSSQRTTQFEKAPPTCIDAGKAYTAKIETTEGDIEVALDPAKAPVTVNSFVVLARYHYYDDVPFHRIVPGFVDQAGTPVDQASPDIQTNPGYTIDDELPDVSGLASPADAYPDGTLAMANRGKDADGKGTNSSQFFIVVKGGGAQFAQNPNYTVFGKVTSGLDVAEKINGFGDAASNGTPTKDVRITKITITER